MCTITISIVVVVTAGGGGPPPPPPNTTRLLNVRSPDSVFQTLLPVNISSTTEQKKK